MSQYDRIHFPFVSSEVETRLALFSGVSTSLDTNGMVISLGEQA
ncbi:hypothetical protein [Sphingobium sp. B11D3D]|nr:hypothetical protein [Sphingobium sp. B11D3D]MCW2370934.1 hypothetical protein [Sphingobium sp. B11D3D]